MERVLVLEGEVHEYFDINRFRMLICFI